MPEPPQVVPLYVEEEPVAAPIKPVYKNKEQNRWQRVSQSNVYWEEIWQREVSSCSDHYQRPDSPQ